MDAVLQVFPPSQEELDAKMDEYTSDPEALGSSLQDMNPSDALNTIGLIVSVTGTANVSDAAAAERVSVCYTLRKRLRNAHA